MEFLDRLHAQHGGARGEGTRPTVTAREADAPHARPGIRSVGIAGIGTACPDHVLGNADLERLVDTSDEWILERTGIRERRRAAPGIAASDLGAEAAREALGNAGLEAADVELIVVATATPDTPVPATACHLQRKIGASRAAGFDLSIGCSGFVNALMTAEALVARGNFANALVVGTEVLTSVTDYEDRTSCILFGDAAGAAVLAPDTGRAVLIDHLAGIDGEGADALGIPSGGSLRPTSHETVDAREHFLRMDGRRVFRFAVEKIAETCRTLLERNGYGIDDLALLVPHQANLRILEAGASRLGIPMDRVAVHIEHFGNTSSASIPLALQDAERSGRLERGDLVCLVGFGAGLSWAGSLVRW